MSARRDRRVQAKLRPYLARTIGTAGDGRDAERIQIARAWLIERLSKSLDLAGCEEAAERLRALPDGLALKAFHQEIVRAREEAKGARRRALARLRATFPAAAAAAADAAYAAPSPSEIRAVVEARLAPFVAEARQAPFDLLERMLPTEVIQLPVVDDAAEVCALEPR